MRRRLFASLAAVAAFAAPGVMPAAAQTRSATPSVFPEKATTVGPIRILQVRPTMYLLVGPGGNSTVQVGEEGVLVVDTMTAQAGPALVTAIRTITNKPILQIINTHGHPDHVGGNEVVRNAGVYLSSANTRDAGGASILAREEVLNLMSAEGTPYPKLAWPTDTFFVKEKDLFMNGDAVQVFQQPAAHTDGDALVLFRRADVLATGDIFTPQRYPRLDLEHGGSINGLLAGLNRIIELTVPEFNEEGGTVVIPGHGRLCDESDVADYRDMVTIVLNRVADMVKKKATLEQVKAAKLTLDYDGVYGTADYTGDQFVEAVYKSLTPAPAPAAKPAAAPARTQAQPQGGKK